MIHELSNNEIFSNEYRNIAPKAGDLAAVFEKNGRNLLMRLDAEGAMSLPEAVLFADYWFDPQDAEADQKVAEKGGRLVYLFSIGETGYYSFLYMGEKVPDFAFTGMTFLPFGFENEPLPKNIYFGAETAVRREVLEEAGIKVTNIRYYKSQPWGFASNLMIGVICDLDGSDEIAVHDTNEVAEAVWIPREEIRVHDNGVSLTFEMIARFKEGAL